jgi:hypothetical protein
MTACCENQALRPGSLKVWGYPHTRLKITDGTSATVVEARAGTGLAGFAQQVGFGLLRVIFNDIILSIIL